ncbi:MAG TPA: hypothetical protein VG389_11700 [Myxococcota bacterium]|nr:hypothetical protein [Myxococcota bacterium]
MQRVRSFHVLAALLAGAAGLGAAACERIVGATMTPPRSPPPLLRVPCSELVRDAVVSRDGWSWLSPLPAGNALVAAHASAPGEAWLAGAAGTLLHARAPGAALRGAGRVRAAALAGTFRANLYAVWSASPVDVVAVGAGGRALRCDGIGWSTEDTGTPNTLRGLWAADPYRVFAVGDHATVLVREANRWRPEKVVGVEADLESVIGFPEVGRYYAVGSSGEVLSREPEGVWRPMVEPSPARLRAVWGPRPGALFVAGDGGVLMQLGAAGFTRLAASPDARFTAVWGTPERLFVAEERGTVWTRSVDGDPLLAPLGDATPLAVYALAGTSPGDVWRAGAGGAIAHHDGAGWRALGRGPYDDLARVVPTGADAAVLVTTGGAVLRYEGGRIVPVDGPPNVRWNAAAAAPAAGGPGAPAEVYVVGESTKGRREGYVAVLRGALLSVVHTVVGTDLRALVALPDGSIAAAGQGTAMCSGTGATRWRNADGPAGAAVQRMAVDGDGRLYALDTLGQVYVRDAGAGAWRPEPLAPGTRVYGAATLTDGRVALVGAGGVVLLGKSRSWAAGRAADAELQAVAFLATLPGAGAPSRGAGAAGGAGDGATKRGGAGAGRSAAEAGGAGGAARLRGMAVGAGGEAAGFDGANWFRSDSGAAMTLRDVAFGPGGDVWACGDGGALLHLGPAALELPAPLPVAGW